MAVQRDEDRKVVFLDREKAFDQLLEMGGLLAFEDQVNESLADADWDVVGDIVDGMDDVWLHDLMRKEKQKEKHKRIGRIALRTANAAAYSIAIFISVFVVLFVTIEPVRAQVIRFIVEHYPKYSYYSPLFEEEQPLEALYRPTYIPEGFTQTNDDIYSFGRTLGWQNNGYVISFRQAIVDDNSFLDTEAANVELITINGDEAALIQNATSVEIYFVQGDISFTLTASVSLDEAVKIAESIQKE